MKQYHPIFFLHLKLTLKNNNNKKGLPPSSTFRKCPDDKLTIYFAWPNLKSGQKTKWPNIVDRSVYRMKDIDPIFLMHRHWAGDFMAGKGFMQ